MASQQGWYRRPDEQFICPKCGRNTRRDQYYAPGDTVLYCCGDWPIPSLIYYGEPPPFTYLTYGQIAQIERVSDGIPDTTTRDNSRKLSNNLRHALRELKAAKARIAEMENPG